ncbi:MAG: PepSY domain-containing protein [Pyrinomonadaceae bacterium]
MNARSITKLALFSFLILGVFGLSAARVSAQEKERGEREGKENTKLAKKAKITLAQAREIALREDNGTVEGEELEKEHGKLVYSFDIRNATGTITEIWVDAKLGKVVHKSEENAAAEAKEQAADMKKKGKN